MTRREFVRDAAAFGLLAGCATAKGGGVAQGEIRAYLMHLGWNMWSDIPVASWGPYKTKEECAVVCAADRFRTDVGVWNRVTERMAKDGYNMVIVDVGEALAYPSHPELGAKGCWSPERMREEVRRLRALGLEPIPKLNFSAAHDTWLGPYHRMVSTRKYYEVCADVIRDVAEAFDHPRFLHLGYDEETAGHQRKYAMAVVRQGELWWHDFLWFVGQTTKAGMRPWIWSDFIWHHKADFLARMPKDVLQSNWYYGKSFATGLPVREGLECNYVDAYLELEKAGFDQVPTGSNWSCDENLGGTVEFCRRNIDPSRLKGFMMAPWFFPDPRWEQKLTDACRLGREAFGA